MKNVICGDGKFGALLRAVDVTYVTANIELRRSEFSRNLYIAAQGGRQKYLNFQEHVWRGV